MLQRVTAAASVANELRLSPLRIAAGDRCGVDSHALSIIDFVIDQAGRDNDERSRTDCGEGNPIPRCKHDAPLTCLASDAAAPGPLRRGPVPPESTLAGLRAADRLRDRVRCLSGPSPYSARTRHC